MTNALQSVPVNQDPMVVWLTRQLQIERMEHKPDRVDIGHLNAADVLAPMDQFDVKSHDEETARTLASQLRYLAQMDAEVRGHMERYAIRLFWPGVADPTYHAFSVDGAHMMSQNDMLSATEPPTSAGLIKQLMRHTEVAVRVAMKGSLQMQEQYDELVGRLIDRVNHLETHKTKVIELGEQLMTQNMERELQRTEHANDQARKQKGFDEMMSLFEIGKAKVIEHVSGVPMLSSGDPGTALIREVMTGLDAEGLKKMMEPLEPAKKAMVLELYKAVHGVKGSVKTAAAIPQPTGEEKTDGV